MKAPEILDKAAQHMRDRAATYDKPEGERSMGLTVAIFNLYHGTSLTEAQGWHLMQILKDVRLFARPGYHADSAEDCTAYSALKAEAMALQHESAHAEHAPVVVPPQPEYEIETVARQSFNRHPDINPNWQSDDGLIEWSGGDCPVKLKHSEMVEVKYRNGYRTKMQYPELQPWMHFGCAGDIIAYRVIKQA